MSVIFSAFEISKSFGAKTLFQDLTLSIESGQKIGLIGPNGAGKSTLLQILARMQSVDSGKVSYGKGLILGYLEQAPKFKAEDTVYSAILEAHHDPDSAEAISKAFELISKLELDQESVGIERPVNELSGGWRKRVALARELIKGPTLFLLDEPTNHLDVPSILWLEDFLAQENLQNQMAYLIVTHDRAFLQNTCELIFDLDRRNPDGLIRFDGPYSEFLQFKSETLNAQKELETKKRNTLRRETEWLRRGAQARQTKQKARIDRAGDLAQEVQGLYQRNEVKNINIEFAEMGRSPKKLVEAQSISKKFQDQYLFKDLSLLIRPNTRLGILGKNGCGKSTLIKILIGQLQPDSGSVKISDQISFSYFEQQKDSLNPKVSLIKTLCPDGDYVHVQGKPVYAKSYLSRFHFRPDQYDLPVAQLSGGEQSRLLIAKMMMASDPVLILDEPTNDLDVATLDVLQDALAEFPGAVIIVTHDRYFMDQVANQILAFPDKGGQLVTFADVFQWQDWHTTELRKGSGKQKKESAPAKSEKKKLGYKDQLELDGMEAKIAGEEAQLKKLEADLENPDIQKSRQKLQELSSKIEKQKALIEGLYARWEILEKS